VYVNVSLLMQKLSSSDKKSIFCFLHRPFVRRQQQSKQAPSAKHSRRRVSRQFPGFPSFSSSMSDNDGR
jgi:hypothetical protein